MGPICDCLALAAQPVTGEATPTKLLSQSRHQKLIGNCSRVPVIKNNDWMATEKADNPALHRNIYQQYDVSFFTDNCKQYEIIYIAFFGL